MKQISFFICRTYNTGYIALMSVIALGAISLAITVSLLYSGVITLQTSFVAKQKVEARMAATSCAEEALQVILDTGLDTGSGGLSIGSTTCSYSISSTSSLHMLILSTGHSGSSTSKISTYISSSTPRIKLSSWVELSDF